MIDHACWAAGENHRLGRKRLQKGIRDILERVNFAIDIQFPQSARNQLRDLTAEIDDQKFLVGLIHGRSLAPRHGFCNPRWWPAARQKPSQHVAVGAPVGGFIKLSLMLLGL